MKCLIIDEKIISLSVSLYESIICTLVNYDLIEFVNTNRECDVIYLNRDIDLKDEFEVLEKIDGVILNEMRNREYFDNEQDIIKMGHLIEFYKKKNNYRVANQLMIKEIENFTECLRQSNEVKSIK